MSARPRIVLAAGVYDNADILDDFFLWYLDAGVDHIVVFDYGSTDGSRDLLESYRRIGVLYWQPIPSHNYSSFNPFDNIAGLAQHQLGGEWIIVCDTDEFVTTGGSTLRESLAEAERQEIGVLSIPSFNMTGPQPTPDVRATGALTLRIDRPIIESEEQQISGELPMPFVFIRHLPKTIVRAADRIEFAAGAHAATSSAGRLDSLPGLRFLHYPIRGYPPFEQKVRNITKWLSVNTDWGPGQAWHWRRWVRIYQDGGLREEYDRQFVCNARAEELVRDGVCSFDRTVRAWINARERPRQP